MDGATKGVLRQRREQADQGCHVMSCSWHLLSLGLATACGTLIGQTYSSLAHLLLALAVD